MGGSAIIAACTIIFCMILLGIGVGMSFGWHRMDSLFLGGMIAMSSTTIIYKAFDDLGLRKKQFTGLVLSILILEDILAIVLMVMLSTMAVSHNFEGTEMLESIGKLLFVPYFMVCSGIYLIPEFLKRCRKLMGRGDFTYRIPGIMFRYGGNGCQYGILRRIRCVHYGVYLSRDHRSGIHRSISETGQRSFRSYLFRIGGYDVDPAMIVEYAIPIIVITLAVILGQAIFGTFGVILSGKPLKTAMQCGFSLTQIGEFAFIIASLGVSLHVTSDFLYPIVVAVSVITTFLTPYMIRLAEPASTFVDAHLPESWRKFLMRYSSGSQTALNHENLWKKLLIAMVRITVVYSIVSISIIALSFRFVVPFFKENLPHFWASLLGAVFVILCIAPFLRAIMVKKNHSVEFVTLWHDSRTNRAPLVSTIVIRIMIAALFVIFVISGLFKASIGLIIGVAVLVVLLMVWSRRLKKRQY